MFDDDPPRRTVDTGRRRRESRTAVVDEVGLADKPAPMATVEAPLVPTPAPLVYRGPEPPGAPHWQPKPVEGAPELTPAQKKAARQAANADQTMLGVSGTANLLGFLHDLGEINVEFQGLNAMKKYDLMRRTDGTIAALEAVIRLLVRRAEWAVETGVEENEPGYALAKEIRDFVEQNLKEGMEKQTWDGTKRTQTFESAIENATLAAPYGCSGHEYLWAPDNDKNKIRLSGLAPRLPTTFYQFLCEPDGETLRTLVQFGYRGALVQMAPVPANKVDIFTLNREGAYFYGRSVFRPVWRSYYAKTQLIIIDLIGSERNRLAIPTIVQGPNATPDDKQQSWQWVENLSTNERTGLSLPNGWEFSLKGVEGRQVLLTESIKFHDEEILVGGLADFIALGRTTSGSRALGDVKLELFLLAEQAFGNMIAATITNGAIRRLVDYNWDLDDDQRQLYPRLRCADISMLNVIDLVGAIKDLANSNVDWLQPTEEGEAYILKRLGMPQKEGPGRVKYAPVVERIQEMVQGGEEIPTQSPEGTPEKQGTGNRGQGTAGSGGVPQAAQQTLPSGRVAKPAAVRQAESQTVKGKAGDEIVPWRELKQIEKKHDFAGHVARADTTARVVARLLRAGAPEYVAAIAADASRRHITDIANASAGFPHALAARVEKILGVARRYGKEQVYRERRKATGRSRNAAIANLKLEISDQGQAALAAPKRKVTAWFNAQAVIADYQNEVSKRVRARAIDLAKDGLEGEELQTSVTRDILGAADGWIDRLGEEAGRAGVASGRDEAFAELDSEIASYVRSELMDHNTCAVCEQGDGQEWSNYDEIDWQPGDDCEGGDACRGQIIPVFEDEGAVILE